MANKLSVDPLLKLLTVTAVPDVDDIITFDVQIDLYSDLKEDWLIDPALNRFSFPVRAEGGQVTAAGVRGTLYTLLDPWRIVLYDADHEFRFAGALVAQDGTRFWRRPPTPREIAVVQAAPSGVVFLQPPSVDDIWEANPNGRIG